METNVVPPPSTLPLQPTHEDTVNCNENGDTILSTLQGPNGTKVLIFPPEKEDEDDEEVLRPHLQEAVVVTGLGGEKEEDAWSLGRAGMRYRDLIPGRLGGRYIASHIHIPQGGPVPDYCHYHHVHFQMIFCYKGWVKVVYEDQGSPFLLQSGDCVLQPPRIRHRVLESSDNLEVIEIGSPASHRTIQDFNITLPNEGYNPSRRFSGQKFVRHLRNEWKSKLNDDFVSSALWGSGENCWEVRDTGIWDATEGLASVRVVRPVNRDADALTVNNDGCCLYSHSSDLYFLFVLHGNLECSVQIPHEQPQYYQLTSGSSLVIPSLYLIEIRQWTRDVEVLEVQVYR